MNHSNKVSRRSARLLEHRFVGVSQQVQELRSLISRVSSTDVTVLIQGESGTGKEVVANLIHEMSDRSALPFVPVNCGAIPSDLLESELFGHEKGAFTGAVSAHKGRFELADGGTLFLDEIGDMPYPMQVKLLRVLQERSFQRVGGTREIKADVRIIAATHQNLESKIEDKQFRADLFYRLNVFPLEIPPLRDRPGDVEHLIDSFLSSAKRCGAGSIQFSNEAIAHLDVYRWPGNVRELSNLVERSLVMYPGQLIEASQLPIEYRSSEFLSTRESDQNPQLDLLRHHPPDELFAPAEALASDGSSPLILDRPLDLKARLAELEKELIVAALEQTDWTAAHAANWLKLQRTTLVEKMRKYNIKRQG